MRIAEAHFPLHGARERAPGRRPWRYLLALSFALAAASSWAAQRFGQDRGLPSQTIEALALDERRFLWVGTIDGLVRFDGHRFLDVDLGYGQPVVDPKVTRLLAVPGAVYIAAQRGLHRFDLASETLTQITAAGQTIPGVVGLRQDHDGSVLAVTDTGQLYRWQERGGTPQPERLKLTGAALPTAVTLAPGPSAIWIGTTHGVYRLDRDSLAATPLRLELPEIAHGAVHISAVHEDAHGELWIGGWNDGLIRYALRSGAARRVLPGTPAAGALRSTSIYRFLEGLDGELLIGSNRGLVRYLRDCDCYRGLNDPAWDAIEGRGIIVSDLALEAGGAVWAGSWGTGLVRFSASDRVFERQVRVDGRADSVAHPMITALLAEPDGRLWIGSYGGGVQWTDAATRTPGEFWSLSALPWGERRVESRFIWTLHRSAEELIIGTGHGLWAWSEAGKALRDIAPDLASVRSLLDLDDGSRLVGTMFGLFREQGDALVRVPLQTDTDLPAAAQSIWSLARHGEEIWAGSASGLWRLQADLSVRAHHDVGADESGLPGPVVWTQKTDAQGRHWLGTSGGLVQVRSDGVSRRFVRHARAEGAGSQSVASIEVDRSGQLWLGTPHGLVRYRPERGERRLFDASDGLISAQLNANASTSDGERLYFGGVGGLVAFDPLAMPEPDRALHPQVVQLRLGEGDWQAPAALTLKPGHPSLHVELSAQYFEHPEQVRYAYRWSPGETAFTELGDARSAVFSRLPQGRHTLELRATLLNDPAASATTAALDVTVLPAWHETLFGRLAVLLGLASLAYAVFAVRSQQIRQQAQALAREVRQRTHELSAAKEALESVNAQLQRQADTDPLTGLDNRRRLFETAARWQRDGRRMAAVLIDLDHFKQINDEYGHQVGDAVLADFAALMRATFGERACCSRYGGEEFLALLDADATPAEAIADELLHRVRERRIEVRDGARLGYTASIGLAQGSVGEAIEALIRRADQALYRAKEAGRDRSETG